MASAPLDGYCNSGNSTLYQRDPAIHQQQPPSEPANSAMSIDGGALQILISRRKQRAPPAEVNPCEPALIFILSGKRKSGKDFVTAELERELAALYVTRARDSRHRDMAVRYLSSKTLASPDCPQVMERVRVATLRVAGPIKRDFAREHGLDIHELLSDSPYKELYRRQMVDWSDAIRRMVCSLLTALLTLSHTQSISNYQHSPD